MRRSRIWIVAAVAAMAGPIVAAAPAWAGTQPERTTRARPGDDTSGRTHKGVASYYHPSLNGRKMANGERFAVNSNSAASRTLPLGTTAKVTNLENGRSTTVQVEDRGPYVAGRSLDVSPRSADELGLKKDGVASVEIAPIQVPQRDGSTQPGAGAK